MYIVHVLCAVTDVGNCGATYQTAYTNNCIYIFYMKYLVQVGAECLRNVNKDFSALLSVVQFLCKRHILLLK